MELVGDDNDPCSIPAHRHHTINLKVVKNPMTTKAAFSTDEWNLLRSVPAILAAGVSTADPSGLFGSLKEAAGGMKGMVDGLKEATGVELAQAILEDRSMPGMPDPKSLLGEGNREEQMANLRKATFEQVKKSVDLLGSKATPEETTAYKSMLMKVADAAANASKEGGFLGIGGERVSAAEQNYLDELKGVLIV